MIQLVGGKKRIVHTNPSVMGKISFLTIIDTLFTFPKAVKTTNFSISYANDVRGKRICESRGKCMRVDRKLINSANNSSLLQLSCSNTKAALHPLPFHSFLFFFFSKWMNLFQEFPKSVKPCRAIFYVYKILLEFTKLQLHFYAYNFAFMPIKWCKL